MINARPGIGALFRAFPLEFSEEDDDIDIA
jgi:hypothetical protein